MLFAMLSGLLWIAPPAPAAEAGITVAGRWTYAVPDNLDASANIPAGSLILNPEARRAFQIFELEGQRTLIRLLDLDSLRTIRETTVPQLFTSARSSAAITQYIHGIDTETNDLFLPFQDQRGFFGGVARIDGATGEIAKRYARTDALDPTRMVTLSETPPNGQEDVALCTSAACQPQTFGVQPIINGMEFIPSYVSGGKPKILMLWSEGSIPTLDGNVFVVWATQWDVETGRQDFNYRVQGCTAKLPLGSASQYAMPIFQARLGAGIYVGCNGAGFTGVVVRIRLNANGQPDGEDTYPGPQAVLDTFGDRNTDRLLFRVSTFTGEAYWVFSGGASTYTGVIGATLTNTVVTWAGVDEADGRLYVMVPRNSRGDQVQESALVTSDFRRSPAPQVTAYPGAYIPNVDMQLQVDTAHPSGHNRIFVHARDTTSYVILDDPVPPSFDEPLTDIDRFTVDHEEQEGVTAANFTGTGHAYGLRGLLAGGVQGMVPPVTDVSGINGRFLVSQTGSPCQTPDREIRLGSIPYTTLANNLASAEAAAASSEPGTVADLREPTGRCHPTPNQGSIPRVMPEDDDDDGQSNADEMAGTEWPFFAAQCSGDGESTNVTTVKPLDRRPTPDQLRRPQDHPAVPAEAREAAGDAAVPATGTPADGIIDAPRQTPLRLDDNRAEVVCDQTGAVLDAEAVSAALEVDESVMPADLGAMTVAGVGGFNRLWRDPQRGLVSETIAYARGINIGDEVSIDVAYSRAVAFAGGRPGTAGTILERRICGVSIPRIGGQYSVIPIDAPVDTPLGDVPPDPDPVPVGDPLYDLTEDVQNPTDGSQGVSYPIGNVDPYNHSSDDQNVDGAVAACAEAPVSQANGTPLGTRPFLEALNRVLGSRGRAYIPEPDPELRQGSPGGYLASLQKDRFQQIGARAVSNDGSTQVPALEIQIFNDDPTYGRGRQLFQFAGVDASVTYGIYLLNPDFTTDFDDPGDDLPDFDITDDLPPYTGGPTIPPLGPSAPPSSPPATGVFAPVTYVYRGVTFLARNWKDAVLAGAVMLLLAAPLVLLGRRRSLRTLA